MDSPLTNPYATQEQALLDWHQRLAEKERALLAMQRLLIDWGNSLTRMAQVLDEIRTIEGGEPVASRATGDRPALKLVPHPEPRKEPR